MGWQVLLDGGAEKYLKRLPRRDEEKIREVVQGLKINPYTGDLRRMKGEKDTWRRRIGSYRLFFVVGLSERVVYIFNIERRTSHTY